jgi:hypothetical protein
MTSSIQKIFTLEEMIYQKPSQIVTVVDKLAPDRPRHGLVDPKGPDLRPKTKVVIA